MPIPPMADLLFDILAQANARLLLREPFYGHYLSRLARVEEGERNPSTALRLGADFQWQLWLNPDYWQRPEGLNAAQLQALQEQEAGRLKHQVLHLIFGHPFRRAEAKNKALFDIAADLAINQYLRRDQLPEGGLSPWDFPEIPLALGASEQDYYEELELLLQELEQRYQALRPGEVLDPQDKESWAEALSLSDSERLLLDQLAQPDAQLRAHGLWAEAEKLSFAERELASRQVEDILKDLLNSQLSRQAWDSLPGALKRYLEAFLADKAGQMPWRQVLRLFAAHSRRTRALQTLKRPSKRYGTVPGIKIRARQKILVALDTSASISEGDLALFFTELRYLCRQGAEVYLLECDAALQKHYPYRPGLELQAVQGGGGTRFEPALDFARQYRPDALIYFTDGYGQPPQTPPTCPLLWVFTPEGLAENQWDLLPGRKLRLNS